MGQCCGEGDELGETVQSGQVTYPTMNQRDQLAQTFEPHRHRLTAIAYRMLGSLSDAEDVVQDAFLRWREAPREDVLSDGAYLTTIVTRLCLDHLKSARAKRMDYVGPWLPEPVVEASAGVEAGPDSQSLSLAFLVLLESLTPQERAAYLLHEVFDYSHREVASILGLSELHCR
jgi:RNA polymerase sigma-70 factor (ECF subfamily)